MVMSAFVPAHGFDWVLISPGEAEAGVYEWDCLTSLTVKYNP